MKVREVEDSIMLDEGGEMMVRFLGHQNEEIHTN